MPDLPTISVIVPSYNQGRYLESALISIVGQGYPRLEVIVVDGGSTDESVDVIKSFESRLAYWHSKPDNGQADAINHGMALCTGDVVCWLNSDDTYLPGTLLDVGRRLAGRTDRCHLVYGSSVWIREENDVVSGSAWARPFDVERLRYYDYIVQPSSFWTRELWRRVGPLETSYSFVLDWDWFIRASRHVAFEYIAKYYAVYRIHAQHKTGSGGQARRREIIEIVRKYSTPYWVDLYTRMEDSFPRLESSVRLLRRLRVPGRDRILPWLFPGIAMGLHRMRDFQDVVEMFYIP